VTVGGEAPGSGLRLSACIEWLFAAEAPEVGARIRLAGAAGFRLVEFWHWSTKDLAEIGRALDETGLGVRAILAEPKAPLVDPAAHSDFLAGLRRSIAAARQLGAPMLIVQAGDTVPGRTRAEQRAALERVLSQAAEIAAASGVTLALEPLNTRIERPDYFLSSTSEALDIIDAVGHPAVRLLYDLYHSAVMGEAVVEVLAGRIDRVAHVHLADVPGRGEPGSGALPWRAQLRRLVELGYRGAVGLEYRLTGPTRASLDAVLGTGEPPRSRASRSALR
jgi:hydroxypyruvate isomerase